MKGHLDVSNELMNHFTFMLKYVVSLRKEEVHPLGPVMLTVITGDQQLTACKGNSIEQADEWYEQCIREQQPDYAVYVKDAFLPGEKKPVPGDAFIFILYDKQDTARYIFAQRYLATTEDQPLREVGAPAFMGLLSNEPLYSGQPPLPRVAPGKKRPWWKSW